MDKFKNANCIWYYLANGDKMAIRKVETHWVVEHHGLEAECIIATDVCRTFNEVILCVVKRSKSVLYYAIQTLKSYYADGELSVPDNKKLQEHFLKFATIMEE